jgi:methionine biosynthesis protein MetW
VARHIIISVPNFGHWRNRWYLASKGRMPVTSQLDYEWYETPNIHFCTLRDFADFAAMLGLRIAQRVILDDHGARHPLGAFPRLANLFGSRGVFLLVRDKAGIKTA